MAVFLSTELGITGKPNCTLNSELGMLAQIGSLGGPWIQSPMCPSYVSAYALGGLPDQWLSAHSGTQLSAPPPCELMADMAATTQEAPPHRPPRSAAR